ncbi:MAG TPA: fibronectin type III domain-containing protein [Bacteroidales bacterium]|nr:fibronectin type III domain-containing protein [Bacteroidales bacterium]
MNRTRHIFRICTFFLFLLAILPGRLQGQKPNELYAARQNSTVQLYWDCRSWAPDQKGYRIMRSPAGKNQWEFLHQGPIIPSVDTLKDFSLQGLSEETVANELLPAFRKFLKNGMLSPLTAEDLRLMLKQNNGLGAGDRIRMKNDFNLALVMGFACIDPLAEPDQSYDYALYEVRLDGSLSTHPLDTFRLGDLPPIAFEVGFRTTRESVIMEWKIPASEVKANANIGFKADRTGADGQEKIPIATQPVGAAGTDSGMTIFRLVDVTANPENDYLYYLIPVNVFGQEGKPVTAAFLADRYRQISMPVISMIELVDETDLKVSWEINPEDQNLIQGFRVEYSKEMSGEHARIVSDTLDALTRVFVDQTPKKYGDVYYYRITAMGKFGQETTSGPEATYYMGLVSPPDVTGLRSMPVKKDSKLYVNLVWTPKESGDTVTRGYVLYSDELIPDSFLQITSLPLITENQSLYPINTQGGRRYRFRVAGISEQGKTGKPAETAIDAGTLHLPKITRISSELLLENSLLIRWQYQPYPDLKGFKLLINGKTEATPETLLPDMRSYLITSIPESDKGELRISLVAVGSETESESGFNHTIYIKEGNKVSGDAPQGITYETISEKHPEMIQLCWNPPVDTGDGIAGYALFSDYAGNGKLYRINTIPVIYETSYVYTNELKNRSSITIGVAAVYKNGRTGNITSVTVPFKNQEFNINQQR